MTTKEFIEILQKEDPDGTMHIRGLNGVIVGVESKPGYWDGPYSYIERGDDNRPIWVTSTKGNKIDIIEYDLLFLAELYKGNWEEMEKHIRVEYDYLDNGERKRQFIERAKKECEEYNVIVEKVKNFKL